MNVQNMYINGEWVPAAGGKTRLQRNPATGAEICLTAEGGAEDVARASAAAAESFKAWGKTSAAERAELMNKAADIIDERIEEIARAESLCSGQLLAGSRGDAQSVSSILRYYAGIIGMMRGHSYNQEQGITTVCLREPIGVVGLITPWNAPIVILINALAPAIAAGNTVVIKPSSITPLGTAEVVKCFADAGFPAGVINLVLGSGETIGDAMGNDPRIGKISFTGGTETGKSLIRASASNVKLLALELGGKSPVIVFEDADTDAAIDNIMSMIYSMAGELCIAGSRVLVQSSIYDAFVGKLADRVSRIHVGDPMDEDTEMGPVVSEVQMKKVLGYIETGKAEGARLVTGGHAMTDGEYAKGFFIEPTVFADVTNDMRIAREEIFGPVLCVLRFDTEEEAFDIANDTIYGLAAGCYTKDLGRAWRFAKTVTAAVMWVNTYGPSASENAPICCLKQSGYAVEMGLECLESFTLIKNVSFMEEPIMFGDFRG